jgi:hypothetical protein
LFLLVLFYVLCRFHGQLVLPHLRLHEELRMMKGHYLMTGLRLLPPLPLHLQLLGLQRLPQ